MVVDSDKRDLLEGVAGAAFERIAQIRPRDFTEAMLGVRGVRFSRRLVPSCTLYHSSKSASLQFFLGSYRQHSSSMCDPRRFPAFPGPFIHTPIHQETVSFLIQNTLRRVPFVSLRTLWHDLL